MNVEDNNKTFSRECLLPLHYFCFLLLKNVWKGFQNVDTYRNIQRRCKCDDKAATLEIAESNGKLRKAAQTVGLHEE